MRDDPPLENDEFLDMVDRIAKQPAKHSRSRQGKTACSCSDGSGYQRQVGLTHISW